MKNYEVDFYDPSNGATSPIDTLVNYPDDYTAEKYVEDCLKNADADYNNMLATGSISLVEWE